MGLIVKILPNQFDSDRLDLIVTNARVHTESGHRKEASRYYQDGCINYAWRQDVP